MSPQVFRSRHSSVSRDRHLTERLPQPATHFVQRQHDRLHLPAPQRLAQIEFAALLLRDALACNHGREWYDARAGIEEDRLERALGAVLRRAHERDALVHAAARTIDEEG